MVLEHRNLRRMLEVAIVAARLAGQRAMEEINYIKASVKNKRELVTETDSRCQRIIIERIKENYPDHGFIAEEGQPGKIFKQQPRSAEPIWWVIDPLDGTNNFVHRILSFTVSIAVMYQGEPIVGVVFDPATDSMFTAIKDGEAQFNTTHISAGQEALGGYSSIGLESYFEHGLPAWVLELMGRMRFRNFGTTALGLAYVARGSLVGVVLAEPKLWDFAAGAFIAETAGAVVTDWNGGKIFPVDLESYEGGAFKVLATNKKVHPEILQLIKTKG